MRHSDTLDKIVGVYLAGLCHRPFRYKDKLFLPKPLVVSPLLLRGYTCPTGCGACCGSFSLDFLPGEVATTNALPRTIQVDHRRVSVFSDLQRDVADRWCRNLDRGNGRCRIYAVRPLACDFELIRLLVSDDKVVLIQKQYGRAWAMARLDGERGALCEMLPADPATAAEVNRKLERLERWAEHLDICTRIPSIIRWVSEGDHTRPLYLEA